MNKSKKKYNESEKGRKKNREFAVSYRANPANRHRLRMSNWKKRGLKYYPINIHYQYESIQNCSFCNKQLKKNFMEHNHTTGSFRGFTCSRCNTFLSYTDKNFRLLIKELKFVFALPIVIKNLALK